MPNPPQGTFCWTELLTRDANGAKTFYTKLLGWETAEMDMGENGTYTTLTPKGQKDSIGGIMEMVGPQFENVPPHWLPYIAVDDVDASAAQTGEFGGQVLVPPTDIPNIGRFCVIQDPTGGVVALFKTAH